MSMFLFIRPGLWFGRRGITVAASLIAIATASIIWFFYMGPAERKRKRKEILIYGFDRPRDNRGVLHFGRLVLHNLWKLASSRG
jgi:hypothetical protein